MDTKYNQSYKTECEQPNVEIRPNDTIIFELMPSNKKIYGKVEIHNRTLQDQMYRIKTTAPDYYIFRYHKDEAIPPSGTTIIEIELICDESRLQHRLKDKFLIEIVEKQKYEAAPSEDSRWKQPFKNIKLGMSMMRKELISSQTSLRKSQGQINSYFAQSKILCGAPQILTTVINQDENISDESRGIKLKLESLKQKFQEQAKLIEQYKFDINELQNEIDRNSFIYDLEKKNEELQPEENIVNALRDKTGIPLWELFLAATIAVILGALLNKQ